MSTWEKLSKRFDGVVGYRICLTHRRSPVRTRVEPIFFRPELRELAIWFSSRTLFSDEQEEHGMYVFIHMMRPRNDMREMDDKLPPVSQKPSSRPFLSIFTGR